MKPDSYVSRKGGRGEMRIDRRFGSVLFRLSFNNQIVEASLYELLFKYTTRTPKFKCLVSVTS